MSPQQVAVQQSAREMVRVLWLFLQEQETKLRLWQPDSKNQGCERKRGDAKQYKESVLEGRGGKGDFQA